MFQKVSHCELLCDSHPYFASSNCGTMFQYLWSQIFRQERVCAPLPHAALTTAVVISGTGDKHYFPSNSLIMSVLPHGWLSKANPEPLTPAEGLCVHGEMYSVCVCVCVSREARE